MCNIFVLLCLMDEYDQVLGLFWLVKIKLRFSRFWVRRELKFEVGTIQDYILYQATVFLYFFK